MFCLDLFMYDLYKVLQFFRASVTEARSQETLEQTHQRQEKDRTLTSAARSNETPAQKTLRNEKNKLE